MIRVRLLAPLRSSVLLALALAASPAPAQRKCVGSMTLIEATNRASEFVGRNDPSAALTSCYEPFYEKYFVDSEAPPTQLSVRDRFLSEYADALVRASQRFSSESRMAKRYYERAMEVAETFFSEFAKANAQPGRRGQNVVANLIKASVELRKQADCLRILGEIGDRFPASFRPAVIDEWERLLKSDAEFKRELHGYEVRRRIGEDLTYKSHWMAYKAFLGKFRKVPLMAREADRRAAVTRQVTGL